MYPILSAPMPVGKSRYSDVNDEPLTRLLSPIKGYELVPIVSLEKAISSVSNLFDGIDEYVYVAKENSKTPADGLSQDESASIHLYTMHFGVGPSLYMVLNKALRTEDRDVLKPWFPFLKIFLAALYKIPSRVHVVWRGVRNADLSAKYPKGTKFVWWGVSSCTLNVDVLNSNIFLGKEGLRTLFSIECKHGKPIGSHSYFQNKEQEIILVPGSYFEVIGQLNPAAGLYIIQLKQLAPPIQFLKAPFTNLSSISTPTHHTSISPSTSSTPVDSQRFHSPFKIPFPVLNKEKHQSGSVYSSLHGTPAPKHSKKHSSANKNFLSTDTYSEKSFVKTAKFKGSTDQHSSKTTPKSNDLSVNGKHSHKHDAAHPPQITLTQNTKQIKSSAPLPIIQLNPSDQLFVNGPWWNRFYQEQNWYGPFQHFMNFDPLTNALHGYGNDIVGDFIISGAYDKNTLQMTIVQMYQLGTGNAFLNSGHRGNCSMTWNHQKQCFVGPVYQLNFEIPDGILEMWPDHIARS